jgi:hypothetical protein
MDPAQSGPCNREDQRPHNALSVLVTPPLNAKNYTIGGARRREPGVMPASRRLSNWLSSTLVSRALGVRVPDSQSGYRAMTRKVAAAVRPGGRRYEFETEFLFQAAQRGFRIAAVEIPTVYEGEASHFRYLTDTLRLAGVFLRHWRRILAGPGPMAA